MMTNVLSRLKAGTVALLRGGDVAELVADAATGESSAVAAALQNALDAGADAPAAESKPEAGGKPKKDKAGRMPGDEGYDENDLADEPEASAPVVVPSADAAALAAARNEGRNEGRTAEQARWSAVMGSPELAGREALAHSMLSTTELSADQIVANLKAAPKANQAGAAGLDYMNPDLGAGGDAGPTEQARIKSGWDEAIANYAASRGLPTK
jgi:hypothetical protein